MRSQTYAWRRDLMDHMGGAGDAGDDEPGSGSGARGSGSGARGSQS